MMVRMCDSSRCNNIISEKEKVAAKFMYKGKEYNFDLCEECFKNFLKSMSTYDEKEKKISDELKLAKAILTGNLNETRDLHIDEDKTPEVSADKAEVITEEDKEFIEETEVHPKRDPKPKTKSTKDKRGIIDKKIDEYGREKLLTEYKGGIHTASELADLIQISRTSLVNYFSRNGITKRSKEKSADIEKESHT